MVLIDRFDRVFLKYLEGKKEILEVYLKIIPP